MAGVGGLGMIARSSKTDLGGGVASAGQNFRRNFLLRRLGRFDPCVFIRYWSNWRTSTTLPVLSHLRGYGPVWFWMRTWSPILRAGRRLVCSESLS